MMDLEMDLLATGNSSYRAFNSAVNDLNTPDISTATDLDIGKILAANIDTHTAMETREDVWGHESFDIFSTMDYGLCLPATLVEGSLAASEDSVIVPVSSPPTAFYINTSQQEEEEEVKVKLEALGEDEKYRRMRNQNNDASKRCREKRKRKAQEMEEELTFLEERNQNLKEKFESMEREVKAMKRRLLTSISSNK